LDFQSRRVGLQVLGLRGAKPEVGWFARRRPGAVFVEKQICEE
jgi:hypothetical protein